MTERERDEESMITWHYFIPNRVIGGKAASTDSHAFDEHQDWSLCGMMQFERAQRDVDVETTSTKPCGQCRRLEKIRRCRSA